MPAARVIAIDTDPVLLALGRTAYGDRDGLRFADVDLRSDGWTGALGLDRPADAAVSTTALHWLRPEALHVMYARLATVLRRAACARGMTSRMTQRPSPPWRSRTGADRARGAAPLPGRPAKAGRAGGTGSRRIRR
jgi:hypothetical protein